MEVGRRGEEIAAEWLVKRGFRVLERNWRSGHKEVDLVVESERAVHIVEVKTLTPPVLTLPAEKVDARKQARLVAAARRLIAERHIEREVQFDVIAVVLDDSGPGGEPAAGPRAEPRVEYIPEAFYPIIHTPGFRR